MKIKQPHLILYRYMYVRACENNIEWPDWYFNDFVTLRSKI